MQTDLDDLLVTRESAHMEFKEAKARFDFEELARYCAALANEGGGRIALGVRDGRVRSIVGSLAFPELERAERGLFERTGLKVRAEEIHDPRGRVVIFHVPPHRPGSPVADRGAYWMRAGDSVVKMEEAQLRRLLNERVDFSAEPCPGATLADLDPEAVERFRQRLTTASPRRARGIGSSSVREMLRDSDLLVGDQITNAALLLLGTREALTQHIDQAEIVVEYHSDEKSGRYSARENFREPYLVAHDRIWSWIEQRRTVEFVQDGFVMMQIPTWNELAVREAILNAFCHREYRSGANTFVRQYPRRMEIQSPGGFPEGVTQDSILFQQHPRNRRLVEALERCGMVERANHGAKLMFGECAREGKAPPDFKLSNLNTVRLVLGGEIVEPEFVRCLAHVPKDVHERLSPLDFVALSLLYRGAKIPLELEARVQELPSPVLVVTRGGPKGRRVQISPEFLEPLGNLGHPRMRRRLDPVAAKAAIEQAITDGDKAGISLDELSEAIPELSYDQLRRLLKVIASEGRVHVRGRTRGARWFSGPRES